MVEKIPFNEMILLFMRLPYQSTKWFDIWCAWNAAGFLAGIAAVTVVSSEYHTESGSNSDSTTTAQKSLLYMLCVWVRAPSFLLRVFVVGVVEQKEIIFSDYMGSSTIQEARRA